MTDSDHAHDPQLDVDPADHLQVLLLDAHQALSAVAAAFRDVSCPGCDPTGDTAATLGAALHDTYGLDMLDGDMLLSLAADAREFMHRVLIVPHCHHDE